MANNLIIIVVFLIFKSIMSRSLNKLEVNNNSSICMIKSTVYPDEYLYSSTELEGHHFHEKKYYFNFYKRKVFTKRSQNVFERQDFAWLFTKLIDDDNNKTYHITNMNYENQYLCASYDHLDKHHQRLKVHLHKLTAESRYRNKKCMWMLTKRSNSSEYLFINKYYLRPLNGGKSFSKNTKSRNIYLMHLNNQRPKSSFWFINCSNNITNF